MTALLNNQVLFKPFIPKTTTSTTRRWRKESDESTQSTILLRWKQPNLCKDISFLFCSLRFLQVKMKCVLLCAFHNAVMHRTWFVTDFFFSSVEIIKTSSPFCVMPSLPLFAITFTVFLCYSFLSLSPSLWSIVQVLCSTLFFFLCLQQSFFRHSFLCFCCMPLLCVHY